MVATLTAFCFAGFGTDRLRCKQAMKTAGRENQNPWAVPRSRAHGAAGQNGSCSNKWAEKQRKTPAAGVVFFLDFSLYRTNQAVGPSRDKFNLRDAKFSRLALE
jgi:hypothetical protein